MNSLVMKLVDMGPFPGPAVKRMWVRSPPTMSSHFKVFSFNEALGGRLVCGKLKIILPGT